MKSLKTITRTTLALSRQLLRRLRVHRSVRPIIPLWRPGALRRGDLGFYPGEKGWEGTNSGTDKA
jgi:hypothetical protein